MSAFRSILISAILSAFVLGEALARPIGSKQSREDLLSSMELLLEGADDAQLAVLSELSNPFFLSLGEEETPLPLPIAPAISPLANEPTPLPVVPVVRAPLRPAEVLQVFARQIQPTGSILAGARSKLTLATPSGTIEMRVGSRVPVRVRGRAYQVRLSALTSRDFTFSLGDETLTLPLRSDSDLLIERGP